MYINTQKPEDKLWACSCPGGIDHARLSFVQDTEYPDEFYIVINADGQAWWDSVKFLWRAIR